MSRLFSTTSFGLVSLTGLGFLLAVGGCSSNSPSTDNKSGGSGGGNSVGGSSSGSAGKPAGTGGTTGGTGGSTTGGTGGSTTGGTGGTGGGAVGGSSGSAGHATGATGGVGATGGTTGGSAGSGAGGGAGMTSAGGSAGTGSAAGGSAGTGQSTGGMSGSAGSAGSGGGLPPNLPPLVTSASGAYWQTSAMPTVVTSGTADVTVNDTSAAQTWAGFGGAFNELGWSVLTSSDMQTQALTLLFSATDGAHFAWGRIPMGASDYATSRYTDDDTANPIDVTPTSSGSNRPPADTSMAMFSLTRDGQKLIPYIKAAQGVNSSLRFWASPWTPPVWMKTGYKTNSGADSSKPATKPSYFDGGNMSNAAATLTAYAQYYTKFVQGYKDQGINIEIVSPQNEPGYDQNYPSCLWDKATYTAWIGQYLGPAMKALNVQVMLGTLSNDQTDIDTANGPLMDATAKTFLSVAGVQWNVLDKVNSGTTFGSLPIWATEHKCGNYPWNPSGYPAYNSTQAPNDQAYGVESWGYIRDAITKGKVSAYNAWNMVLDKSGLGIDTTRDWKQDALLVADSGKVNPTPAYYVFRHFSQYVVPMAKVVGTTGGDAVAFKNPDGSLVAVMYNSAAAKSTYTVKIGGKMLQFAMPSQGWATVYVPAS